MHAGMWQLLGGALPTERDESGAIFIDRDGVPSRALALALALALAPTLACTPPLGLARRALPLHPQLPARRHGPPATQ